jgi:hypothetical protein
METDTQELFKKAVKDKNSLSKEEITILDSAVEKIAEDYVAMMEFAKFPPLSYKHLNVGKDFKSALEKEWSLYTYGDKPYNKFSDVEEKFIEEISQADMYRAMSITPEKAALQFSKNSGLGDDRSVLQSFSYWDGDAEIPT